MNKRKTKALFNLLPILATSILAISSFSVTLSSCDNDDPEPPTPPQPTEQVTLTFDAGEGGTIQGISPSTQITTLVIDKGVTWPQIKYTYSAFWDDAHPFKCWSFEKDGEEIPDSWAFNSDAYIYAVYWEHEHKYDIYGVNEETHQVYVECSICHERRNLTDKELQDEEFKNKLLVKRQDGDIFYWELTSNSVEDEIENPLRIDGKLVSTIYLMNGVYDIGGYISSGTVIANLYGVTTQNHEMLATINCCTGNPIGMPGIELHINNSYMLGAMENIGRAFYFGLQPDKLYCDNCYFKGQQTVYAGYGEFTNCIFDSSVFELYYDDSEKIWKTEYALYLYNTIDHFEQCTFIGKGKAVKIYSEGQKYGSDFTFIDVDFVWVPDDDERLTKDQFKACIEVDSTYQPTEPYVIYYKNLQQDERRPGVEVEFFNDKSTHHKYIKLNKKTSVY